MILWELLLGFLRVGCFSFGGAYSAIPLIRDVVSSYGWMNDETLSYMIAVSESTPGPIMVNLATYIGSNQAGLVGAIIATVAVVLPAFIIILLVMAALNKVIGNKYVQAVMRGLTACMIGIIFATGISMAVGNVFSQSASQGFDLRTAILTVCLGVLLFGGKRLMKKNISPILFILISAGCGIIAYGVF